MDERVEPLPEAPEGTCRKLASGRGVWAVRGRSGWFRCNPETQWCECSDFLAAHRRGASVTQCAHLRGLARHLNRRLLTAVNEALAVMPSDAELRRIFS